MNMLPIFGSGGGGGGGGGGGKGGGGSGGGGGGAPGFSESPNTVRSASYVRTVELISAGEVNAIENLYLDGTPLTDGNGNLNFQGVVFDKVYGTSNQSYLPDMIDSESEVSVGGGDVLYGIPRTVYISDTDTNSIVVTLSISGLTNQDTNANALYGSSFSFKVEVQSNVGSFNEVISQTVSDKSTSPFELSYNVPLSGTGPWYVRVSRTSPDNTSSLIHNSFQWARYTKIINAKLNYPGLAMVGISVDARYFNKVATRAYMVEGIKISVPSNRTNNTITDSNGNKKFYGTYSGIWNGSFKTEFCSNPVWVLYYLLTNKENGLGIDASMVDSAAFYTAGVYCDALVSDGMGGTEARFSFNGVINAQTEAYQVIQAVASSCRCIIYATGSYVTISQDAPTDPLTLVTQANVIDGRFNYSGTARKARHTIASVSFNDPNDFFRLAPEVYEADPILIEKYGYQVTEVSTVGCTSRGQAHRAARYIIETEWNETETVTYQASLDQIISHQSGVRPGSYVKIADPEYQGVRWSGRALSASTTQVTLDAAVVLVAGQTYTLSVMLPDSTIQARTVTTGAGTVSTLTVGTAFTTAPLTGSIWVLSSTSINPRVFRIIGVREIDPMTYEFTGLYSDQSKFARIENGVDVTRGYTSAYEIDISSPIAAPNGLAYQEWLKVGGIVSKCGVTLSWTPSIYVRSVAGSSSIHDPRIKAYEVQWQGPSDTYLTTVHRSSETSCEISDITAGTAYFRVRALSATGVPGQWSDTIAMALTAHGTMTAVGSVSAIELVGQGLDNVFVGRNPRISWVNSHPRASEEIGAEINGTGTTRTDPFYRDNVIRVYDVSSGSLLRTEALPESSDYTYTYERNVIDNLARGAYPSRSIRFSVTLRDILGRESDPATLEVVNPPPDVMAPTITAPANTLLIQLPTSTDLDWRGNLVWASTSPGFTPESGNLLYQGSNTLISIPVSQGTWYIRIAAYDSFWNEQTSDLNVSAQYTKIVGGITGTEFSSSLEIPGTATLTGGGQTFTSLYNVANSAATATDLSNLNITVDGSTIKLSAANVASNSRTNSISATASSANSKATSLVSNKAFVLASAGAGAAIADSISAIQVNVNGSNVNLSSANVASASSVSSLGGRVDSVSATAGSAYSSVNIIQNAFASSGQPYSAARYGVYLNTNGAVSGFQLISIDGSTTTPSTEFKVQADKFTITPSNSGTGSAPFVYTDGTLYVNDAVIGNISASKVTAGTISSGTINVGSSSFKLDASNKNLIVNDGAYDRVTLGKSGSNYGLWLKDASGNTFLTAEGLQSDTVTTAMIKLASISYGQSTDRYTQTITATSASTEAAATKYDITDPIYVTVTDYANTWIYTSMFFQWFYQTTVTSPNASWGVTLTIEDSNGEVTGIYTASQAMYANIAYNFMFNKKITVSSNDTYKIRAVLRYLNTANPGSTCAFTISQGTGLSALEFLR